MIGRKLTAYAALGATVAALALFAWGKAQQVQSERLRAENATLEQGRAAMQAQLRQNAAAMQAAAEFRAAREAQTAALIATIDAIKEIPDAPLDPALVVLLDGLRQRD